MRAAAWTPGIVTAALWLALVRFPAPADSLDIDASWQRAYGHAEASGLQLGRDFLLAHGPLGHLELGLDRWDAGRALLWEGGFKLALAFLLARLVLSIPHALERIAALALLALLPYHSDSHLLLGVFAAAVPLLQRHASVWIGACAVGVLAALALVKHSLGVATMIAVVSVSAAAWSGGDRRRALALPLAWMSALALLWKLAGQEFANVRAFLRLAWDLVAGYSDAMAAPAPAAALAAACAALLLGAGLLIASLREASGGSARRWSAALLCALLFLAFKASFVRHGGGGAFGPFAAAAAFLWFGATPLRGALHVRALAACLSLAALAALPAWREHGPRAPIVLLAQRGSQVGEALAVLASPLARREELERRRRAFAAELELPRTRAAVGDASLDVFPYQAPLATLNGLRWRPRPIFQSYSAYTQGLLSANARALAGAQAPRFLLLREGGVDGRFEPSEDGPALLVVARDYAPVLQEEGFLLLERRVAGQQPLPARELAFARELELDTWLDLEPFRGSGTPLVLSLDVRPSLLGLMRTALFQGAGVHLELEDAGGERHRRRLVPALLRAGVLVEPHLKDREDWIDWHAGRPVRSIRALRVVVEQGQRGLVQASVGVRLERADVAPPPDPGVRERTRPLVLEGRATIVAARTPRPARVAEQEVLVIFAPAEVRLPAEPGRRVLTGRYGVLEEALAGGAHGAGIAFVVSVVGADGVEREVCARDLDPWRRVEDRGAQALRAEMDLAEGDAVVVRTRPVSGEPALLDWAWVARLRVE